MVRTDKAILHLGLEARTSLAYRAFWNLRELKRLIVGDAQYWLVVMMPDENFREEMRVEEAIRLWRDGFVVLRRVSGSP